MFLLILAVLGLGSSGCVSEDARTRQEVMRLVKIMNAPDSEITGQITNLGPRAIPYIAEALDDPYWGLNTKFWLISALHLIGDRHAIPVLVKMADKFPSEEVTNEMVSLSTTSQEQLSVYAQLDIARMLLSVSEREKFGNFEVPFPDLHPEESAARRKEYCTNLNKWYKQWRKNFNPADYATAAATKK
jgi:hypothetical protein